MRIKLKTLGIIYFLSNLLITGCTQQDDFNSLKYSRQTTSFKQASNLLAEISNNQNNPKKQDLILAAIDKYIEANLNQKAYKLLSSVDPKLLNPEQSSKLHLLKAKIYLNNNKSELALAELSAVPNSESKLESKLYQEKRKISIHAIDKINSENTNNSVITYYDGTEQESASINTTDNELSVRVDIDNNLKNDHELAQRNKKNIWHKLITQDQETLDKLINKTKTKELSSLDDKTHFDYSKALERKNSREILLGWLELAKITRTANVTDDQKYFNLIKDWQNKYSNHPASEYFDNLSSISNNNIIYDNKINKIAVMLPLTGTLATAAKAIKEGILTAYYTDNNPNKPELFFIDTYNQPENIEKSYKEAIDNKADLIIGPLNKTEVNYFVQKIKPQVPTIALNYTSENYDNYNIDNFYQFGISGEDEAEQAAYKLWQSDLQNTLIIVDDNKWGKRVIDAFNNKFKQLGGNVANVAYLNQNTDLKKFIYQTLGIESSQKRKNTLQWILDNKLSFQPRHRKDFDSILLVTTSLKAKQIKPILKFYYADNIPVIATSNILDYKYMQTSNNYKDLNGIQICDMPLILHNNSRNKQIIQNLRLAWPNDYENFIRLYALGIDAYKLGYNLNKLTMLPNLGILANTGHLVLEHNKKVSRKLPWAKINNNGPTIIEVM